MILKLAAAGCQDSLTTVCGLSLSAPLPSVRGERGNARTPHLPEART